MISTDRKKSGDGPAQKLTVYTLVHRVTQNRLDMRLLFLAFLLLLIFVLVLCAPSADRKKRSAGLRWLSCGNGRRFLPEWKCDGIDDCRNRFDERNCTEIRDHGERTTESVLWNHFLGQVSALDNEVSELDNNLPDVDVVDTEGEDPSEDVRRRLDQLEARIDQLADRLDSEGDRETAPAGDQPLEIAYASIKFSNKDQLLQIISAVQNQQQQPQHQQQQQELQPVEVELDEEPELLDDTSSRACGGEIRASFGTIQSPMYPALYPNGVTCIWTILAPRGRTVKLTFADVDLEGYNGMCYDYVTISELAEPFPTNAVLCGREIPRSATSKSNRLTVTFHSDGSVPRTGFRAEFVVS